jgi:hypothetical protein
MTFPTKRNILTNQRAQLMNVHAAIAAMRDQSPMPTEATMKLGNIESKLQSVIADLGDVLKFSLDPGIDYSAPAGAAPAHVERTRDTQTAQPGHLL